MRQNIIIVLLSICCTLLAVNLAVSLRQPVPPAFGQAVGTPTGQVAIAPVQGSGNEPWCYVYDVSTQVLAVYTSKGQGIELKGVRKLKWDLMSTDVDPQGKKLKVSDMKKSVEGKEEAKKEKE